MGHRLAELAELIDGRVEGNPDRVIENLTILDDAEETDLTFVTGAYKRHAGESRAGAFLVDETMEGLDRDLLVSSRPRHALATLIDVFHPEPPETEGREVHPTAVIDPKATVDESATIGAYCVVGAGSVIEAGVRLYPHVIVGRDCRIGADSIFHPNVVLYDRTQVGARALFHAGVKIGADGYSFASDHTGHQKLRHIGRVVIGSDVEIGSNSTVDRALLSETRIGDGTKIDNLVQVGHNVRLGRACLLVAQVGLAGSTRLGSGVVIGGQSGTVGHLEIGDYAQVAAKSVVFKSVPSGAKMAGTPAIEIKSWRRLQALLGRLGDMSKRLRSLERRTDVESGGDEN